MSKLLLKKRIIEIVVELVIINKKLLNSKNSVFFYIRKKWVYQQNIRKLMFVLWVRLSINFGLWSMNVTSCYLERRFYLSQDYNRAIRRLLSPLYNKDLLWYNRFQTETKKSQTCMNVTLIRIVL